jgi:hypothetical protein
MSSSATPNGASANPAIQLPQQVREREHRLVKRETARQRLDLTNRRPLKAEFFDREEVGDLVPPI